MVQILEKDTEFRRALAAFLVHEEGVKLDRLSEENFEKIGNNVRTIMSGNDAEITRALWSRAARHHLYKTQAQGLILFWCGLNVYLFWSIGFQHFLSWQAALWLIGATPVMWLVVGGIGSAAESWGLMFGVHVKITRGIKYLIMLLVFSPIFHLLFTGRF